ncbi:MAG: hypothetical protein ACYC77_07795 [Coriobacteriia bacterium]
MTDEITTSAPVEGAAVPAASPAKPAFFSTAMGKVVMVLGALSVLAIIAAVVIFVAMFVLFPTSPEVEVRVPEGQQQPAGGTDASGTPAATQPAARVTNDEVFTFRDIFKPLLVAADEDEAAPSPSQDSTSTDDATEYAADTLYLLSVSTEGDTPEARMVWDQESYTLSEGDSIPDSPWKVLEIRDDSVVMLFGDQQVILTVGQGIQK